MKNSMSLVIVIAGVLVSLTLIGVCGQTGNSNAITGPSTEVGRFTLESGTYLAPSHTAARVLPGIFKIDTVTGQVWRYTGRIEGKQTVEEWVAIGD